MKKILYIHQYFRTPAEGGALRSYHIAKAMVAWGMEVEMITSHNQPNYEKQNIEGITVHYLPVKYANEFSPRERQISFIKFVFKAIRLSGSISNIDLVYATSTPLTVGLIAIWMKWTRKIPYFFEVRDLWPKAPIQLGIIKSLILKWITRCLEKTIYKNAQHIIALSPGIAKGVKHTYRNGSISMIPNMADIEFFGQEPLNIHSQKEFTIGYFGAFGMANHRTFIVEIAKACQDANQPIRFLLVGEGAMESMIITNIKELKLNNILILPAQNREEIKQLMLQTDACLTTFLNVPILETNSPNKFFDGLAAGKLSLVNTKGWLKELVEEHQCGVFVNPECPDDFPASIAPFIHDQQLLEMYQKNARNLAKAKFSKDALVRQVCELIDSMS